VSAHIKRLLAVAGVAATVAAVIPVASAAGRGGAGAAGSRNGSRALWLRAAPPVAAAARPVVLGGLTQRGWPVVLSISRDTRRLNAAVIALDMSCTSGGSFTARDAFGNLAIHRNGRVHVARSILPIAGSTVSITGGSHALNGTLNRRRMTFSGWWHLHVDFQTSSGQTDHCDSGRVNFAATL
jgi:hypothetical protein